MTQFYEDRKHTVDQIRTAIPEFFKEIDPASAFKKWFWSNPLLKLSFMGALDVKDIDFTLYRVRKCEKRIDLIKETSYNPAGVLGRCNLPGKDKATLYLTNFIVPGLFETIIKSRETYLKKYNSEFAGKYFIIGEWKFKPHKLRNINYHCWQELPKGYKSKFIEDITKKCEDSIKDKTIEEQELIKSIVLATKKIFYYEKYELSAALCDSITFPENPIKNPPIDFIWYPTSITELIGTNFSIPKRIADNASIVSPIKYNFGVLKSVPEEVITEIGPVLDWDILEVGEPDGDKIKWRHCTGKDDPLIIKDGGPEIGKKN